MTTCFQIKSNDNTAVLLADAVAGETVTVIGAVSEQTVQLNHDIEYGHKVALIDIAKDASITKYGITIGHATVDIQAGDWVHLHNCASDYDERSATLDVDTGATTDTVYE